MLRVPPLSGWTEVGPRDYWPSDPSTDVNLLESRALLNALVSFKAQLSNSCVDVNIDNKVLKSALDDNGCKNYAIKYTVKEIGQFQKITIQYEGRLFGIPNTRGGFLKLELRRHGGVLTIGILKVSGGFRFGISRGYRQVFLWAFFFLLREQT